MKGRWGLGRGAPQSLSDGGQTLAVFPRAGGRRASAPFGQCREPASAWGRDRPAGAWSVRCVRVTGLASGSHSMSAGDGQGQHPAGPPL